MVEYLGEGKLKNLRGEILKFDGEINSISEEKTKNLTGTSYLLLSHDGAPLYYDTAGTAGHFELEKLGDRIMLTLENGHRFIRYTGSVDFFTNNSFPLKSG